MRLSAIAVVTLLVAGCKQTISPVHSPSNDGSASPFDGLTLTLPEGGGATDVPPATVDLDCAGAAAARGNMGCTFYATPVPVAQDLNSTSQTCFAMFVVNPGSRPVKLAVERAGTQFSLSQIARVPRGAGRGLTYAPFDEAGGLAGGDVAILFLNAGPCPDGITPATSDSLSTFTEEGRKTLLGTAFHVTADRPVIAYQIIPYGGAGSHVTSSTLLLPREAWGQSHVLATPVASRTFLVVIAAEDNTQVTVRPSGDLIAGAGLPAVGRGGTSRFTLAAGGSARYYADGGLSGSLVGSSKPVSVIGGTPCFSMPDQTAACDSAHQQMPPVQSLGNEYVAVRHRDRVPEVPESPPWQLTGAVDGTTLTYLPAAPTGAPTTLAAGQAVIFNSRDPFVVRSQDADHPFHVASYMTGYSVATKSSQLGPGDPDFVNVIPAAQYLSSYVFFTDPTYPETHLVLVRKRDAGKFADVTLDCSRSSPLAGWVDIDMGSYQYTRVDLVTGDFQPVIPGCDNGRQTLTSAAPFGVTVWGWGSPQILVGGKTTAATSYAYPGGASVRTTNNVRLIE